MIRAVRVLDPGLLATVQDLGRPGHEAEGVTPGGAADRRSLAIANALVGNDPGAAALEATLLGPTLEALAPLTLGVAGAMAVRNRDRGTVTAPGGTLEAAAGETLEVLPAERGARGYLAVRGGWDVPFVLGSRSTELRGGFGGVEGRPLRAGDVLHAGNSLVRPPARWPGPAHPIGGGAIRVLAGPHDEDLSGALEALAAGTWTVSARSDRTGVRLEGQALAGAPPGELPSLPVLEGAIQLPPDGRPIALLADHQPTGGYAVIAVVIGADLARLGQLAPGAQVAFRVVTAAEARATAAEDEDAFEAALAGLREAARWDDLWREAGA